MIINGRDCEKACEKAYLEFEKNNKIDKDSKTAVKELFVAGFDYFLEFIVGLTSKNPDYELNADDLTRQCIEAFNKHLLEVETRSKKTMPKKHVQAMIVMFHHGYNGGIKFFNDIMASES